LKLSLCFLTLAVASAFAGEPPADTAYSFRIVQISDTQPEPDKKIHWECTAEAIALVNTLQPDIVVFPGDITHSGTDAEYARMKELIAKIKAPVHLVPGNHDNVVWADASEAALPYGERYRRKLALYKKYLGAEAWSVEFGKFQFIGFDSAEPGVAWPGISADREKWLLAVCRKSSKPYKFLVTHYQIDSWPYSRDPDASNHISEMLTAAGILGHMHGHTHRVEARQDPETGRLVFNSGTAAHRLHQAQPEFRLDGSHRGVMYFDVYDDAMVAFWKPVEGPVRPLRAFDLKEVLAAVQRRKMAAAK
jgi:3',5'-cyclic AMP phosphodiesterase CpdA